MNKTKITKADTKSKNVFIVGWNHWMKQTVSHIWSGQYNQQYRCFTYLEWAIQSTIQVFHLSGVGNTINNTGVSHIWSGQYNQQYRCFTYLEWAIQSTIQMFHLSGVGNTINSTGGTDEDTKARIQESCFSHSA